MGRLLPIAVVLLVSDGWVGAAEPSLITTAGVVVKANASVVILRPRGADGQLGKAVVLKVRGTSKAYVLSTQKRDGQIVPVQRESEPKDLQPDQLIAAIYTVVNDDAVLLVAIVQPGASK